MCLLNKSNLGRRTAIAFENLRLFDQSRHRHQKFPSVDECDRGRSTELAEFVEINHQTVRREAKALSNRAASATEFTRH